MEPFGVTELAEVLKHNSSLTHMDLSRKRTPFLRGQFLADNKIEATGVTDLVEALKYNSSLTQMDLEGNSSTIHSSPIGNHVKMEDLPSWAESLQQNSSILRLGLCKTGFFLTDTLQSTHQSLDRRNTLLPERTALFLCSKGSH